MSEIKTKVAQRAKLGIEKIKEIEYKYWLRRGIVGTLLASGFCLIVGLVGIMLTHPEYIGQQGVHEIITLIEKVATVTTAAP